MDNDSIMLESLGATLTDIQIKFRNSSLKERMLIRPSLEEVLSDYSTFQLKLLKEGVITTNEDITDMQNIRNEIYDAAEEQELIEGVARLIAFIAVRI